MAAAAPSPPPRRSTAGARRSFRPPTAPGGLPSAAAGHRAPAASAGVSAILASIRAPLSGDHRYPGIHRCHAGSKRSVGLARRQPGRRSCARPGQSPAPRCPTRPRPAPSRSDASPRAQKASSFWSRRRLVRHRLWAGPATRSAALPPRPASPPAGPAGSAGSARAGSAPPGGIVRSRARTSPSPGAACRRGAPRQRSPAPRQRWRTGTRFVWLSGSADRRSRGGRTAGRRPAPPQKSVSRNVGMSANSWKK